MKFPRYNISFLPLACVLPFFCALALRADQNVSNTTVANGQTLDVTNPGKVTTSGNVEVQSGGKAQFVGGTGVVLSPGFRALTGSFFRAAQDFNLGGFASLADTDFDGLVDAWEILHFGNLTSATGVMDSDGDGINNAAEYYAGTDPRVNEASQALGTMKVVVKTPTGKFQGVNTQWAIVPAP